jgi:50S ribosomal protein L16 3-hydroxylase
VIIHWPIGLSEQEFIRQYWQKKPLLIRRAFADFENPLAADELAGLACELDVSCRLITYQESTGWHCRQGPFSEQELTSLPQTDWSLLVSDIEKHLPDFVRYLQPFRFIPDWRVDDLMISLAPPGGSVGPHVDLYDVFLLQAEGIRHWSISTRESGAYASEMAGELKILDNFSAEEKYTLAPGDMLYLPPGVAHHGIAENQCMTWSIGFRAPSIRQLAMAWCEDLIEKLSDDELFYDELDTTQKTFGEISDKTLNNVSEQIKSVLDKSSNKSAHWFGRMITEVSSPPDYQSPSITVDKLIEVVTKGASIERRTDCRFAFIDVNDDCTLFVNGEQYVCSLKLATLLCEKYAYSRNEIELWIEKAIDCELLCRLINNGSLDLVENN